MRKTVLATACLLSVLSASAQLPADLILIHGKILTVDTKDSIAQAVAIRQGKIIAVGSDQQIQPLAGPKTNVIDLHGRTATPGLIDTHAHIATGGVDELYSVSLSDAATVSEVVEPRPAGRNQTEAGRVAHRRRLGRRQASGAPLHPGIRSG